jgi:hypothetical protein
LKEERGVVRIYRRELADCFGVVREVQASAEADFQNVAVSSAEQLSPMASQQGLVQEEVA